MPRRSKAQLARFREADPSGLKTFKADVRQWGTPESLLEDNAFVAAVARCSCRR